MNKSLRTALIVLSILFVGVASFTGGFAVGHLLPFMGGQSQFPLLPSAPSTPSADQQDATPENLQTLFTPFWEAWNIVHEQYVEQPVDDLALMQGAIRGMIDALGDEHSSYMDPVSYQTANDELSGAYEGIGAYVDTGGEYLTVTSPIPGSPAEAAGLRAGDEFIAIDGEDMTGIDPELARLKVIGPAGTTVHLTVRRDGEPEPLEFDIVRAEISVDSTTGRMLEDKIAYVQVTTFGDQTTRELLDTLEDLMAQNPRGMILDLRNNGGGYLSTSVEVTSQFLSEGVVLYEEYGDGRKNSYEVEPGGLATEIPLIVLINEGSASAAEIVAGALQDHGRAQLVGVNSYGKGSVQNWVPLSNDQGAVRITIAGWLTPDGRTIEDGGITPDVIVEMTDEDFDANRDPQLDRAVELMLELLGEAAPN